MCVDTEKTPDRYYFNIRFPYGPPKKGDYIWYLVSHWSEERLRWFGRPDYVKTLGMDGVQ